MDKKGFIIREINLVTDRESLWEILSPIIRQGETYAFPRDWDDELQFNIGVIQVIWFMLQSLKTRLLEPILFMRIKKVVVHMSVIVGTQFINRI
jgi:hypothetical protein